MEYFYSNYRSNMVPLQVYFHTAFLRGSYLVKAVGFSLMFIAKHSLGLDVVTVKLASTK